MSIFYNPKTIIDGLVLALDAGNIKSYNVGISSTTWTDIIGRGNTGTLTNGPSYSSQNGGSIVFNGENNYVENLSPNLGISGNTSVTLSCWFYNSVNSSDNQALLVYGNGSTGGDSISILLRNLSFYASFNGGLDAVIADNVYALNTWNNVVVTKTPGAINTTTKLYLNGVEQTITSASSSTPSLSSRVVRVARWTDDASPYYFLGGVSAALIYNRALTAAEVLQNYNSLKNRFVTEPVLIPVKPPYQISRSLRFNSVDSAYLNKTPSVAGNRKTWTWAGWVKRSAFNNYQSIFYAGSNEANRTGISFSDTECLSFFCKENSSVVVNVLTPAVFRDPSAWYHIVVAFDSTQTTASQRLRAYVNGVEYLFASNPVSLNAEYFINSTSTHFLGAPPQLTEFYSGYLADVHFVDGQALTPSSFTETNGTTGQLVPKFYSGTYGVNGFRLNFSDNSAATAATLGADSSGNGNNWTPNNLSVTAGAGNDSLTDTPTSYGTDLGNGAEVRGNYATWNPLNGNATPTNGNLDASGAGSATSGATYQGTIGMSIGKWYWEMVFSTTNQATIIGIRDRAFAASNDGLYTYYALTGQKYSGVSGLASYGASWTTNDVIGIAYDADAGSLSFYKNGVSQGVAYTGLTATMFPYARLDAGNQASVNFGQRPFAYAAPSGFKALCDTSLPTPTIAKGSSVFDTKLYTGNGSTQTISGLGFSPDLVWVKSRSNSAWWNQLFDTVRGAGNFLSSNSTGAEAGGGTSLVPSFTSDGFDLNMVPNGTVNNNGDTYVAWAWDAGSSTVTNTAGTITSQVRDNASAGFSVVTYTGTGANATVGHGLGVAPSMVIVKRRNTTGNWQVRHTSIAAANSIQLNLTSASAAATTVWNSTAPSSTVFNIGTSTDVNASAGTYVAYCFAPVTGYSSFGSYTGNGASSDGPFVYTGFRPKWLLIKSTAGSASFDYWFLWDSARATYNPMQAHVYPNDPLAEQVPNSVDTDGLSNGFKVRNNFPGLNTNGVTYIYAAFAENPIQYSRAR